MQKRRNKDYNLSDEEDSSNWIIEFDEKSYDKYNGDLISSVKKQGIHGSCLCCLQVNYELLKTKNPNMEQGLNQIQDEDKKNVDGIQGIKKKISTRNKE